jgi:hypothetical protein
MLLAVAAEPCAAGGWYLLSPPLGFKKGATEDDGRAWVVTTDAPFSERYREGSFDTAKECMAERERRIVKERDDALVALSGRSARDRSMELAFIRASEAAECVASDDRRLLR